MVAPVSPMMASVTAPMMTFVPFSGRGRVEEALGGPGRRGCNGLAGRHERGDFEGDEKEEEQLFHIFRDFYNRKWFNL
jgi:hypothetical protein